jgi:alkylation response protein AidB-like acyl-CoA dehydrogenase
MAGAQELGEMESVESFRDRARVWLAATMPRLEDRPPAGSEAGDDDEDWDRARELQKVLHSGGFAGICFPKEYGGLGLTPEHQAAFTEESLPYEMPLLLNVPTFSICGATILDMGSEQQKRERLSAAIRGDEVFVQFLSEPRGGSDLAGVITRAERDGDVWVLNGAKIWSTSAYAADWALCLARTDWNAPKHRGLTMFLMKVHQPGVTLHRIRQVNGSTEFCQEFFDDVVLPADAVVGEVNGGWAVASRQLFHERTAVGGGSPYVSGRGERSRIGVSRDFVALARSVGRDGDDRVRELIGESRAMHVIHRQLIERVSAGVEAGHFPSPSASMTRLFHAEVEWKDSDIGLEIAGSAAATDRLGSPGAGQYGQNFLNRQASSLGGGSTEMARNIISERLLGMPREFAADRDVPFNQVKQGRS